MKVLTKHILIFFLILTLNILSCTDKIENIEMIIKRSNSINIMAGHLLQ